MVQAARTDLALWAALGQKQTSGTGLIEVRFAPESRHSVPDLERIYSASPTLAVRYVCASQNPDTSPVGSSPC